MSVGGDVCFGTSVTASLTASCHAMAPRWRLFHEGLTLITAVSHQKGGHHHSQQQQLKEVDGTATGTRQGDKAKTDTHQRNNFRATAQPQSASKHTRASYGVC